MGELIEASVLELAKQIRNKAVSAQELTQLYIDQITRVNAKLNALVQFNPQRALNDAAQLDDLQAQGTLVGPLHGVPFTLKDVYNTKGDIVTAGTLGLKDNVATEDSTIARRLRAAGGILLGKTNTPELENATDTDNLVYGKTINPYDFSRSPGGSSGGSAASVSACCAAFDVGADIGGSLRLPAHYCGLSTIRSSPRRVPSSGTVYGLRTGLFGLFATEGPLCRYVDDVQLILSIIEGPDGIDPNVVPMPSNTTAVQFNRLEIAYFDDDGISPVTSETRNAIQNAADAIGQTGASVIEARPQRFEEGFTMANEVFGTCAVTIFENALHQFGVTKRSSLLEKIINHLQPYTCDVPTLVQRWDHWERFRSDVLAFFDKFDAFICPVTPDAAMPLTHTMWDPDQIHKISYCWAISATLFPTAVVRAGTTSAGLPLGVQIVTKPYNDHLALAIAKEIEIASGGWKKSPLV